MVFEFFEGMSRLLIIDDDHDLLLSFGHLLREKGFEIETCSDGNAAISKIRSFTPDLVVLDVFLGGADGLHICKKLRASEFVRDIPIIVVSGYPQLSNSATRGYGANAFFAKPFNPSAVIKAIDDILSRKREA